MTVRNRWSQWKGRPASAARGFTLVELLVVITIIGMLMAIAFPAFTGVMGTVRLNQCASQLKNLATALGAYKAGKQGQYPTVSDRPTNVPPGSFVGGTKKKVGGKTVASPDAGFSWLVRLLINLDQQALFDQIANGSNNFGLPAFHPEVRDANGRHCSTQVLKAFQCPAFDGTRTDPAFTSNAPEYSNYKSEGGHGVGITNYVAIAATQMSAVYAPFNRAKGNVRGPAPVVDGPNGVICYRSGQGVQNIGDGASKTVIVCETRELNYSSWYDGTTAWVVAHFPDSPEPVREGGHLRCENACRHAIQVGPDPSDPNRQNTHYRQPGRMWEGSQPWSWGPSSEHPNRQVQHLFGDDHVQGISPGINATLYMHLVTRNDREVIPDNFE